MTRVRNFILPLASLALCSCMTTQPPWQTETTEVVLPKPPKVAVATPRVVPTPVPSQPVRTTSTEPAGGYKLDTGDRVRVLVAGQDALSSSYDVDSAGAVDIPTIGKVSARGLNTVQLSGAIARRLSANAREAHVAVQIETYRPFTIRGDVANPGQYPYVNNMTTETAIAIAGGVKPGAEKKSVTINKADSETTGSVPARPDAPVQPGDTITVTEER